ncbi:MAG: hypothetical protein MJ025_05045, partial [Victivallaceae bacterium]|nr:hypothetical protein [Victivallaceae bacterium]
EIINYYAMEAGVRSLERVIASVFRRLAGEILEGKVAVEDVVKVDVETVHRLLGERRFLLEMDRRASEPGRATGLAWTGVGGVILPVEVVAVPGGKGNLKLTGSLGKVMQESAETAFTLVRSVADRWKIKPDFFTKHDFHIHVPDGATPKDGPSAGVTMTMAVLSMVRGKALIPGLAMTGEITLHGRVTAVGGIREKMVAALRAGIREIIMPEENRKDYNELPDAVKNGMKFHFVETWQEAEAIAFGD